MTNRLYYGDNLSVLRDSIPDESVDLIYLDPPFNSNASYNVLFKAPSGEQSQAQIEAFDDTWNRHSTSAPRSPHFGKVLRDRAGNPLTARSRLARTAYVRNAWATSRKSSRDRAVSIGTGCRFRFQRETASHSAFLFGLN
ncbi:hypothetical protein [Methylocystis sp. H4A]|uniref:hypothetical protein n=1 Tax=Methylocystis sp. H4A TaxID=2785788 RepID=UPI0032B20FD5